MANKNNNLGTIWEFVRQALSNRPVYNEQGEKIGTAPSTGDAARHYFRASKSHNLSEGAMQDVQSEMLKLARKSLFNTLTDAGVDEENAYASISNLPPMVLKLLLNTTGYGKSIGEIEKFIIQRGYGSENLRDNATGYKSQEKRNKKLKALGLGLFDYINPINEENTIPGIRPDDFIRILQSRPHILSDVLSEPDFEENGNITMEGMRKLSKPLNNVSESLQEIKNLTQASDLSTAIKQASKLTGTADPIQALSDEKTRRALRNFRATAQMAGLSGGDMYGMLNQIINLGRKNNKTMGQSLSIASNILPYTLNSEQTGASDTTTRKQYFNHIMDLAMNPEKENASKYAAAAKVRLQMKYPWMNNEQASNAVAKTVRRTDVKTPEDFLRAVNQEFDFGNRPLTEDNVTSFYYKPNSKEAIEDAADFFNTEAAAEVALKMNQNRARHIQNNYMKKAFGTKGRNTLYKHVYPGRSLSDKNINYLTSLYRPNDPQKRLQFRRNLQRVQNLTANRMGFSNPESLNRFTKARDLPRFTGGTEKYKDISDRLPKDQPVHGPTDFFRRSVKGKGTTMSNILKSIVGKGPDLKLD